MDEGHRVRPEGDPLRQMRRPRLSGTAAAVWLILCLAVTAVLIPMALRLPRWVAFEIVLAAWWAIWLGALAWLLYTGQELTDDHRLGGFRWLGAGEVVTPMADGPGCLGGVFSLFEVLFASELILIGFGLFLLFGAIWVLFEVAVPLLVFLLYCVARGMLARVVNDQHGCRGSLGRSLGWGLVWATTYTAPLALAVWFIHFAHQRAQAGP